MPFRWVVDADHPEGHLVPMTAEEEEQLVKDRSEFEATQALASADLAARRALARKLAQGTASSAEIQMAISQLLGGG